MDDFNTYTQFHYNHVNVVGFCLVCVAVLALVGPFFLVRRNLGCELSIDGEPDFDKK